MKCFEKKLLKRFERPFVRVLNVLSLTRKENVKYTDRKKRSPANRTRHPECVQPQVIKYLLYLEKLFCFEKKYTFLQI